MVGWIHFTFQAGSLVSLFVIRPRLELLEALRKVEALPPAPMQAVTAKRDSPNAQGQTHKIPQLGLPMVRKITVAYNGSPEAVRALAQSIHLAKALGAELCATTVQQDLPPHRRPTAPRCPFACRGSRHRFAPGREAGDSFAGRQRRGSQRPLSAR
jgi:hypothetical protein